LLLAAAAPPPCDDLKISNNLSYLHEKTRHQATSSLASAAAAAAAAAAAGILLFLQLCIAVARFRQFLAGNSKLRRRE
jgi:hypothetical protein